MKEKIGIQFRDTISISERAEVDRIAFLIQNKTLTIFEDGLDFPVFDKKGNLTNFGFEYIYDLWKQKNEETGAQEFAEAMDELGAVETGPSIFPPDSEE
jgi:hypothetical protein